MAKKGYSLDKGFLFLKNWATVLRRLSPERFHRLFWMLYDYQDSWGEEIYDDFSDDEALWDVAVLLMQQIDFRLAGATRHKKEDGDEKSAGGTYKRKE